VPIGTGGVVVPTTTEVDGHAVGDAGADAAACTPVAIRESFTRSGDGEHVEGRGDGTNSVPVAGAVRGNGADELDHVERAGHASVEAPGIDGTVEDAVGCEGGVGGDAVTGILDHANSGTSGVVTRSAGGRNRQSGRAGRAIEVF